MPRACVIVLDAVGAGELPDAEEYGDAGSNTLGNIARAVGGLDLPNLEALGLGNALPLEGCPPQPGAPAVAGRLLERSKGKDTTTGHWEHMGIVTPTRVPDLPARIPGRRDRPVHEPNRPWSRRQQAGLGDGDHPGARGGASEDGKVDRLHLRGLRLPDRRARGDHSARGAVRGLSRRARDPDRPPRGRSRHRAAVRRGARELHADTQPPRLLARAAPPELPDDDRRGGEHRLRRRQDLGHLRRAGRPRVAADEVERRRDQRDDRAPRSRSTAASSSSTSWRRTCSGGTATTR